LTQIIEYVDYHIDYADKIFYIICIQSYELLMNNSRITQYNSSFIHE